MAKNPDFDLQAAHRYFATYCFNQTWDYIDRPGLTSQEEEVMLSLSLISLWHWTQRQDCTPTNLSVGYWQVARVFALLRQADNARHYGELCLEASQMDGVEPFYKGYAYEALARAEAVSGDRRQKDHFILMARQAAAEVMEAEDRNQLLKDLETIQ